MISTGAMIRLWWRFTATWMVDVEATNAKLIERQVSRYKQTDGDRATAQGRAGRLRGRRCKTAIVMVLANLVCRSKIPAGAK